MNSTSGSSKLTGNLILCSITAALSGFLFGFDTVVISGAEKSISWVWGLEPWLHGLAISSALWGTVLGSLLGGWPTDRFGRKNTLIWIGFLYLLSALWSGLATDVYSFMIARFLGGLGVGISTVAAPLYISEISPPSARGRLAGMFQFNIVFGILIAFVSNYLIGSLVESHSWRWMLAAEAFPALIYMVMCFGLPPSPRWLLVRRNQEAQAREVIVKLNPDMEASDVDFLVQQIRTSAEESKVTDKAKGRFWSARLRIPIMLAFLVAFFNQVSGINAILYFAPRIFGMAGMGESSALLNSVGIGIVNLVFTFIGLYLIDKSGRRTLLYLGSLGYILSLGVCATSFFYYATPFRAATQAMDAQNAVAALQDSQSVEGLDPSFTQKLESDVENSRKPVQQAAESLAIDITGSDLTDNPQLKSVADQITAQAAEQTGTGSLLVLASILAFIAAHAIGQGAVIWVLISEVFPNRHRASGQALGSFTHWIFAAIITQIFPIMIATVAPGFIFLFFTLMMVLQLIWVIALVPETKGVRLEELEKQLLR